MSAAYERLLSNYEHSLNESPDNTSLALTALRGVWHEQASYDADDRQRLDTQTQNFYENNTLLYETVDSTTGDTPKQLADFGAFATAYAKELKGAAVLDIGCGDGKRITTPMADILPSSQIIGIDICPPATNPKSNLTFQRGDFCSINKKDKSTKLATAHWSVLNDLVVRSQQLEALGELTRILEPNGLFYFDVPRLEGERGYQSTAQEYSQANPGELYGRIERQFPGGRVKSFHIFPQAEIRAMLDWFGFRVEDSQIWTTRAGQDRITMVARLVSQSWN